MRVLLIGGSGQLGLTIKSSIQNDNIEIISPNSQTLNLLDLDTIDKIFIETQPEIIINCAAYTDVDNAEIESKKATLINVEGPKYLAKKAEEISSFIIQVSTDYVFGSDVSGPFSNLDKTAPVNCYGKTKSDAELAIKKNTNNFLVLRTASLVSKYDGNFVSSIISGLLKEKNFKIIKNQIISMTCTNYLAHGISSIINLNDKINLKSLSKNNIIHYTNYGYTDWYSIAEKIQKRLIFKGLLKDKNFIKPILISDWKSLAIRPKDSRLLLDNEVFNFLKIKHKKWEDSLIEIIDDYLLLNGFIDD